MLQNSIRKEDYACRFGGDEFILILPDALHEETSVVIERVKQGLWQMSAEKPEIAFNFFLWSRHLPGTWRGRKTNFENG